LSLRNLWIVGGVATLVSGTAIAAPIVVRASGPAAASYPAGKTLNENARITLAANDTLVILDARGTRTLRGPGVFSAATPASAASAQANFSALVSTQNRRRARTGAVRGETAAPVGEKRAPNLWYVDVTRSSAVCLPKGSTATLWRPDFEAPASMTLTDITTGKAVPLAWRAAQPTLAWPDALPMRTGGSYRLSGGSLAAPVTIKLTEIANPETMEQAGAALVANHCDAQLDVLIAGVALPEPTAAGG